MGLKLKKSDILTIKIIGIGLLVALASIGLLYYLASRNAESRIYRLNGFIGPKNTKVEGLQLNFKREDISCSGLVQFDCRIKNPIVRVPSLGFNLMRAKYLDIGTFSKNGIILNGNIDTHLEIKDIVPDKEYNLTNNLTKEGQNLYDMMFPFDLNILVKIKRFKSGEADGNIYGYYSSKIMDATLEGTLLTRKDEKIIHINKKLEITRDKKEAIAERKMLKNMQTIIKSFKTNIKNNKLRDFLFYSYEYYFSKLRTEKEKQALNINIAGKDTFKKLNNNEFISEIQSRIKELIPNYKEKEFKDYLEAVVFLLEKEGNILQFNGQNKDNYTIEELIAIEGLDRLNTDQLKYFNIEIKKTGDK